MAQIKKTKTKIGHIKDTTSPAENMALSTTMVTKTMEIGRIVIMKDMAIHLIMDMAIRHLMDTTNKDIKNGIESQTRN
jgi:hypothetical protein